MRPKGSRLSSKPGARARAWNSMRILRSFTLADLMRTAEIREENADHFIRAIRRAGFIRVEKPNRGSRTATVYRIVRDTGPLAPIPWKNGEVLDQNTRTIYDASGNVVTPTGERPK